MKILKKTVLILSIGIFLLSLTQIAYCTTNLCRSSLDSLVLGFFGVFYDITAITWLANPILFISWMFFIRKPKLSLILSSLAVIISLGFLFFSKVVDNEAGHLNLIISHKLGYWLWVYSSLIMLIGNAISYINKSISHSEISNAHAGANMLRG